jgi:hypothetical protein
MGAGVGPVSQGTIVEAAGLLTALISLVMWGKAVEVVATEIHRHRLP